MTAMAAATSLSEVSVEENATGRLREIVEEVSHFLPQQAPLHAFVHHNPLHAFEHLPFEIAVVEAAQLLGTEPFQQECAFSRHLESGRIQQRDLEAVIDASETRIADENLGGLSQREFTIGRLGNLFELPRGAALDWILSESHALSRFDSRVSDGRRMDLLEHARTRYGDGAVTDLESRLCRDLWIAMVGASSAGTCRKKTARRRDRIVDTVGVDPDDWVHPVLIRFCAAFLDQGIAYWQMPDRSGGLLKAFRAIYGIGAGPPDRWMRGLPAECRRQEREQWDAERTVVWALESLDVEPSDWAEFVRDTLFSLRGWAGMVRHFEEHPDQAPVESRACCLLEYLAIQLTLDSFAVRYALTIDPDTDPQSRTESALGHGGDLAYEAYLLAQLLPTDVTLLTDSDAAASWMNAVRLLDDIERRKLLHLAYERRHRKIVLDGILAHDQLTRQQPAEPEFQAVFCIDEREESFRRHLEEVHPASETFGYVGSFGVSMVYQGLDDVRGRPLCPVTITPTHFVSERAIESDAESTYRTARLRRGRLRHAAGIGTKSLVRGGFLAGAGGVLTVGPLVARCLAPRLAERWSHRADHGHHSAPKTRLAVERFDAEAALPGVLAEGFTIGEMTSIVEALLRTTGLADKCRPLVLLIGHGSSSLNNPHEAAHDCGATGGGRGGPNARAFAAMANHPSVRERLLEGGLRIADDTYFVGAYHNTCNDEVTYYDEDLLPQRARAQLRRAQRAFESARRLDAHERARRFDSAPLKLGVSRALRHAEERAVDLAQPRPEYGHATNAVCIVGRRERTRGLFLDRRAFLVSYDPTSDEQGGLLADLLLSVGPVGAGINLEYYFSFVDPVGYGCGTKLPHNITGLFGVMDGHASDLRTGLPWQMVEIHEPVRLLLIVETEVETLAKILKTHPALDHLVRNRWIQLVAWSPASPEMHVFCDGVFQPYVPEQSEIPIFRRSADFYSGHRAHLGCAHITSAFGAMNDEQ